MKKIYSFRPDGECLFKPEKKNWRTKHDAKFDFVSMVRLNFNVQFFEYRSKNKQ